MMKLRNWGLVMEGDSKKQSENQLLKQVSKLKAKIKCLPVAQESAEDAHLI